MPKISYLDVDKALFDDTEVTQAHIENKIAEIEALMRGMMDEDNLLGYSNDTKTLTIPPSNIADLPGETRPVDYSMKFFGYSSVNPDSVKEVLFDELIEMMNKHTKISILGGKSSCDIFVVKETVDVDTEITSETEVKDLEFPNFYAPIKCSELWNIVKELNPYLGIERDESINYASALLSNVEVTSLEDFAELIGFQPDEYVYEIGYEFPSQLNVAEMSPPTMELEANKFSIQLRVEPADDTGYASRYYASCLFKVIPLERLMRMLLTKRSSTK